MRFAYINSQGKEVGIPSVEALQLRIELGAIVESTMFFDANADRWAPAEDHDIFRTLQREIAAKEGGDFVAPPPPALEVPLPPDPGPPEPEPRTPDPLVDADALPAAGVETAPDGAEGDEGDLGLGDLTLLSGEAGTPDGDASGKMDHDLTSEFSDLGFELTTLKEEQEEPDAEPDLSPPSGPFDFGDFGALEVEKKEPEAQEAPRPPAGDIELEAPLGEQDFTGGGAVSDSLQLERPMSEYTPERPPSWMDEREQEPAGGAPPPPPPPPSRAESARQERPPPPPPRANAPAAAAREERPAPRARPAPPPRQERKSPVAAIAIGVGVLLLAGGGWFAFNMMGGGSDAPAQQGQRAYAPVEIPTLAPELESTFRTLADGALADWAEGLRALPQLAALPEQPPQDWLGGIYLANASQYQNVADYWSGLAGWMEAARAQEEQLFRDVFASRMDAAGVAGGDRDALAARALAGFQAALPERDAAYDAMTTLSTAALELHRFLLDYEAEIEYTPAAGGLSRDPVLEAVPATAALGDEMWDRVDRITAALEDMDALTDRVTTERLVTLTIGQLAGTSVH